MAELKRAYVVCGDDDAKIDAWRSRMRKRAEDERGPGGLELFDGRSCEPEEVAAALSALTFDTGTRYLLVDGVGSWKAAQLEPLTAALASMPPDTVLLLIVRGKALKQLTKAVEAAGGEAHSYDAPKPWELPRWVSERARELGLQLDNEAAKALVSVVGVGQQRLSRELEKLFLALHPACSASAEDVERLAAGGTAPQAYDLADAIVMGDLPGSLRLAEELDGYGERPARLIFPVVRRLREVQRATALLDSGLPEGKVGEALKAPPWVVKKTVAKAKKADRAALERALVVFADLELDLRGGGHASLDEDTAFSLALARAAG